MRLVEIIRTLYTADETVANCANVAQRMSKETVKVNEAPGFITSRINALIGNEAFSMLETGAASAEGIDKASKLGLKHPMGPSLGEKYKPNPLLRRYVREGRLGRKTGRGAYDYAENE